MDPDATLARVRELIARLAARPDRSGNDDELALRFQALDEWLTGGGFLPRDWRPPASSLVPFAAPGSPVAGDVVLPQRTPDEVAARRACRASADPTDDVTAIQRELDAHPTWSDAGVRDTVARVVAATPDDLLEDLEERYDDPAGGVAAPDDLLERYGPDYVGHVTVPVEPSTYEDPAVQRAIAETIARGDA